MKQMAWVFLAGGAGASLRVLLAPVIDRRLASSLPHGGTLVINMIGCFAIGILSESIPPGPVRTVVLGGLLGGLTTFSAFGLLGWELLQDGRTAQAVVQVVGHVVGGIVLVGLGISVARGVGLQG